MTEFITSLIVAMLFAAIFLFGGRAAYRPGQRVRRRFLSFAAGISMAFVFVNVLPGLQAIEETQTQYRGYFKTLFPEYSIYLWTMAGFLIFYGLETMAVSTQRSRENQAPDESHAAPWQMWVHIGGFALYAYILTYLMIWTGKDMLALCLYGVAMGMHILTITCNLSSHYQAAYDRIGAYVLALACVAGWASALKLNILTAMIVLKLMAFVAGGVVVNVAIAEIPKEKEGWYWSFVTGVVVYTALVLILY
jgi:hypothetical protein